MAYSNLAVLWYTPQCILTQLYMKEVRVQRQTVPLLWSRRKVLAEPKLWQTNSSSSSWSVSQCQHPQLVISVPLVAPPGSWRAVSMSIILTQVPLLNCSDRVLDKNSFLISLGVVTSALGQDKQLWEGNILADGYSRLLWCTSVSNLGLSSSDCPAAITSPLLISISCEIPHVTADIMDQLSMHYHILCDALVWDHNRKMHPWNALFMVFEDSKI